ncbi:MAG TPA: rhomboid family intramembrane serine protease [Anaerolineales bacterium]|nr:rhomboid family intramembrane serine protease [Anaerolineales bacterium]
MTQYPPPSNSSTPSTGQPQEPLPPQQAVRVALPQSAPYMTYSIVGVTVIFFILQLATQVLARVDLPAVFFIKSNELIRAGQVWRLLTPALLHDTHFPFLHILFNMYALFVFGTGLERHFGHGRFLLLYVLGAFAGNVLSFLFTDGNSLGASTAIFGLLGAEGVFLYQNRKLFAGQFRSAIGNIIFIAAINLFIIGSLPGIDNWGHIGGLLGGLIFTWFAGPLWQFEGIYPAYHLVDKRPIREVIVGAATVVLIFGGLALWGMVR